VADVEVTVSEVEIVVVLVLDGGTSPFSLIKSFANDDVELRRLNFRTFLERKSGLRASFACNENK
jgi:hypothetical protein